MEDNSQLFYASLVRAGEAVAGVVVALLLVGALSAILLRYKQQHQAKQRALAKENSLGDKPKDSGEWATIWSGAPLRPAGSGPKPTGSGYASGLVLSRKKAIPISPVCMSITSC